MLLTKAELDLAKLVDKEESRYSLQSVAVDKDETVVTNGHYLVRVAHSECKPENWPQGAATIEFAQVNGEPKLLNKDAAIAAAKSLPKRATIPVLTHAALDSNGTLHTNPLEETKGEFASNETGRFPNWRAVMPRDDRKPAVVIGLDADYVAMLAKYIASHGNDRGTVIKLTIWDEQSSVLMESKTDDGRDVQVVLMPVRIERVRAL